MIADMQMVASQPHTSPLTVDEYFRAFESGAADYRRMELIEGRVLRMAAQAYPHVLAVTKGSRALYRLFDPARYLVSVQGTVRLSPVSAPDPDLCVREGGESAEEAELSAPLLVIEISDTSYKKDAGSKLRMYAKAGVQDYWIENLISRRVEVYRQPENPTGAEKGWGYAMIRHYKSGESIPLLARPDISICVDELLP